MARSIVDIALPWISWSGGSGELDEVASMSVTSSDPKAAVKTMNRRRRSVGYTKGVPEFTLELSVALTSGESNKWRTLLTSAEEFVLGWEEGDGGTRYQAVDCVVSEVSDPFEAEGELRETVSVMALDVRAEP